MKSYLLAVMLLAVGGLDAGWTAAAEPGQKQVARMEKLVEEELVDPQAFPNRMPLEKLLKAIQDRLPANKKVALRLDARGLGKDLARVSAVVVRLPQRKHKGSLHWALSLLLSDVQRIVRVDYVVDAEGVLVTRSALAVRQRAYDVQDLIRKMPHLIHTRQPQMEEAVPFHDVDPNDGLALLTHYLVRIVALQPEEKLDVHNGVRLVVQAGPIRQEEFSDALAALRRWGDAAVVMNARLYEMDRAFYQREVAPLWAGFKEDEERPALRRIKAPLLRKILEQKLVLESDEARLLPGERKSFLSQHTVFRHGASHTGLVGVSFQVVPEVSADRRFLRLRITQKAVRLVGTSTTRSVDVFTGKEIEMTAPGLRRTTLEGTIRIPDTGAILMPVSYLPPDAKKDKVWVMVARPLIWIEDEVREVLNQGGDPSPQGVWETGLPEEERDSEERDEG